MLQGMNILCIGAGDLASGVIRRLHLAGARVVATELLEPLTVRRLVSFSEAVHAGEHAVEGVTGVRVEADAVDAVLDAGRVAVVVDPECMVLKRRAFDVVVDARMAKRNLGVRITDASIVIALGPGFTAGVDCHAVVETLQGGGMGRALFEGTAIPDTGKPCSPDLPASLPESDFPAERRVVRAPGTGALKAIREIGDLVEEGELLAEVAGAPVPAPFKGVLRGLVRDGLEVTEGLKIGEIDLTGKAERCTRVSEKANAVAGGVLEACFILLRRDTCS